MRTSKHGIWHQTDSGQYLHHYTVYIWNLKSNFGINFRPCCGESQKTWLWTQMLVTCYQSFPSPCLHHGAVPGDVGLGDVASHPHIEPTGKKWENEKQKEPSNSSASYPILNMLKTVLILWVEIRMAEADLPTDPVPSLYAGSRVHGTQYVIGLCTTQSPGHLVLWESFRVQHGWWLMGWSNVGK